MSAPPGPGPAPLRRVRGAALAALTPLLLGLSAEAARAQADLSLSDEAAKAAATVQAELVLASSPGAAALQVDVLYDPALLTAGAPLAGGGLADHLIASSEPAAGLVRLVIYSPTNAMLGVGQLARLPFTIAAAAAPALTPLDPSAVEVATPAAGSVLPVSLGSGSVHIFSLEADLAVQLGAGTSLVSNGDTLQYTLVADNLGPDAATSIDVNDPVPAGLTGFTWSCSPSGGATCTAAGSGDLVDTVDLPVGGAATYNLAGTVSTGGASIDNLADLQPPMALFDPTIADQSDSVSVDVCTVDNPVLTNWDIGGVAVFNACQTLTAGPDFNVQGTGDVTLRAFDGVIIEGIFSVEQGGLLRIESPPGQP